VATPGSLEYGKLRSMIPRGRLDIAAADLIWAVSACFGVQSRRHTTIQSLWPAWHVLVALSVRTAWDAWLAEQQWSQGDEVLVSSVTIPDMIRIVRQHGLVPIPVPVDFETLSVAPCELERRITSRTRAALIAHLFGSRMAIRPLADVCRGRGIQLIEDAAQAFAGPSRFADSESDVVLLSFGPIKTCTALGGALILLREAELAARIDRRLSGYPQQPTNEFLIRVLKMSLLQTLAWPPVFTVLVSVLTACGVDWDRFLSSMTRGFSGQRFWDRLRRKPAHALIALLEHRLASYPVRSLADRAHRANLLWNLIGTIDRPGISIADHTHWVLPIASDEPQRLVKALRTCGYDATQVASSLIQTADESCPEDSRWNRLVYLPNHPAADPAKVTAAVEAAGIGQKDRVSSRAYARL
jgi:perosamine synthetase